MELLYDCVDSLVHAIKIVAQSVAFLLGMHLVVILHFLQFLTTDPIGAVRNQSSPRGGATATSTTTTTTTTTSRRSYHSFSSNRPSAVRSSRPSLLHLPSLEPRPYEDPEREAPFSLFGYLTFRFGNLGYKMKEEIVDLADQIESRGGKTANFIAHLRRGGKDEVDPSLLERLPIEIVDHILSMAASDFIPTKICLLSKRHYRLFAPRLYSSIKLSNPQIFRHLRMTLALHNSNMGRHIQSLSVASNTFDSYGYFPEGIAESSALGVGLEQILLASPNLKHLYLDLFSLAAAHDGTVSRLQKGSFPISLTTEYAAPQYLSLPIFSRLQHLDLTVFGLDRIAVDNLRQAQPQVKTLTLRWVTRQNQAFDEMDMTTTSANRGAMEAIARCSREDGSAVDQEELEDDMDSGLNERERNSWRRGGHRHDDFLLFIEAIESLRRWPDTSSAGEQQAIPSGKPLEALTILAWPKAMRELTSYYRHDKDVQIVTTASETLNLHDPAWDHSIGYQEVPPKPLFDRPSRRLSRREDQVVLRAPVQAEPPPSSSSSSAPATSSSPFPFRIALDPTYRLGPRRGPLESWSSQRGQFW